MEMSAMFEPAEESDPFPKGWNEAFKDLQKPVCFRRLRMRWQYNCGVSAIVRYLVLHVWL